MIDKFKPIITDLLVLTNILLYNLYAHIIIVLGSKMLCKTPTSKKIYNIYTFVHRISMIISRMVYMYIIYCVMFNDNIFLSDSTILLLSILLHAIINIEFSNYITIELLGYTITWRRLLYMTCSLMLIINTETSKNWLPHILFCCSYLCDSARDIIYIMGGNMNHTKYIYSYVKPFMMLIYTSFTLWMYHCHHIYLSMELIIPFVIIIVSFIDRR